jgi:dihydroorotate dehydrogenase (NAD+) catalytic subunit
LGGIISVAEVAEFLIAGASAVAVGTANFANPRGTIRLIDDLEAYLVEQGTGDVNELVGSLTG